MYREDSISKLKPDEKQIECYRYNFKKGRLGKGTFGTVFKGININNKQSIAIKLIKKSDIKNKSDEGQLLNEIQILKSLRNPNIIEIIDVLQTENNFYIVLEFCDQGDLEHLMQTTKSVTQQDHFHFLIDILTAFTSLIKQGIMHRDLKPANILVSKENGRRVYKLADFGLARNVDNFRHQQMESKVGTPFYMSPQILNGQSYTSKSDIWSLGLILYQIVYSKTPWQGRSEQELLHNIIHQQLNFPDDRNVSHLCKDFILNCLQIKEENRFSWETLYKHPYVSEYFQKFQLIQKNCQNKLSYVTGYLREKLVNEKQLEVLFTKLDTSGDNVLNFEEFSQLIRKIDANFNPYDIKYIFDEFDADGNGTVDFIEFKTILYPKAPKSCDLIRSLSKKNYDILKELNKIIDRYSMSPRSLFRKFDTSQNNALDKEELTKLLQKVDLKNSLEESDIDQIIHVFDENGDGEIQYDEFKKVLVSLQDGKKSKIVIEAEAQIQRLPELQCKVNNLSSLQNLNKKNNNQQEQDLCQCNL